MSNNLLLNIHKLVRKKTINLNLKKNWKGFKNFTINKFLKINLNKINMYKSKNYYKIQSIVVIILDLRYLKSKVIIMNKNKCLFSLTNGMMFKKLQLRNKKYKKSEKLTYLIIKTMLLNNKYLNNYKNIIINIKGVKKNINNIVANLNKKIGLNNKNIIYINNTKFSYNKFFKFKKIKAIKRRLKKKIIKM